MRQTMSIAEIRARIESTASDPATPSLGVSDLRAIERHLTKLEYRTDYNSRPDVKEKRRLYNLAKRAEEKATAQLIQKLLNETKGR